MTENQDESKLNEKITNQSTDDQVKAPGRRKLVIGAVPVAASLISRPIWAGGSTWGRCTISGAFSGPSSSQEDQLCQGLTPGYWKNHSWPIYDQGTCVPKGQGQGSCDWDGTGTIFNSVFPNCAALMAGTLVASIPAFYPNFAWFASGGTPAADLMLVLQEDKGGSSSSMAPGLQLAFHVVAGLLNSADPSVNYGYTALEFIAIVENFSFNFNGATGPVPGAGQMTIEEFKDLLDARNNGIF